MNYQDYIKTELLILVPVLYLLGLGLKRSKLPDKWIPAVLGTSAVMLSAVWVVSTADVSGLKETTSAIFTAVTQGILVAGTSVYANQLYVQAKKEK